MKLFLQDSFSTVHGVIGVTHICSVWRLSLKTVSLVDILIWIYIASWISVSIPNVIPVLFLIPQELLFLYFITSFCSENQNLYVARFIVRCVKNLITVLNILQDLSFWGFFLGGGGG